MAKANDTFVEASDTALESHTPTGPDAGSGWSLIGGSILVRAATDDCENDVGNNGNRFQMNDDLGSDEMDVQADIWFASGVSAGQFVFAGPTGRNPATPGGASYEFTYDWSVGVNGSWALAGDTLDEAWGTPTTAKTLKLAIRDNDQKGYADGVQKVSKTTNNGVGNTRGGMMLGSFSGANKARGDNYQSGSAPGENIHNGKALLL